MTIGAAAQLVLSGATTNLASGSPRTLTATIEDAGGNTVTSGGSSSLQVTFTQAAGAGSVAGLASATAAAGIANLSVTGNGGGSITLGASAVGPGTSNTLTFTITAPPQNTAAPTISGAAVVGQTVTATTGAWTGYPAPTYARSEERRVGKEGRSRGSPYH